MHIEVYAPFALWGRTMHALGALGRARLMVEASQTDLYISGTFGSSREPIWAHFRSPPRGYFGQPARTWLWFLSLNAGRGNRLVVYYRCSSVAEVPFKPLMDDFLEPVGPPLLTISDLARFLEPLSNRVANLVHFRTSADGELSVTSGDVQLMPQLPTLCPPNVSATVPGHLLQIALSAGFATTAIMVEHETAWLVTPSGIAIGTPLS